MEDYTVKQVPAKPSYTPKLKTLENDREQELTKLKLRLKHAMKELKQEAVLLHETQEEQTALADGWNEEPHRILRVARGSLDDVMQLLERKMTAILRHAYRLVDVEMRDTLLSREALTKAHLELAVMRTKPIHSLELAETFKAVQDVLDEAAKDTVWAKLRIKDTMQTHYALSDIVEHLGSVRVKFDHEEVYATAVGMLEEEGFEQDAVVMLSKAAKEGMLAAKFKLSQCYYHGTGCDQDPVQAYAWAESACQSPHASAEMIAFLAFCLETAHGTVQDLDRALKLYREAASKGNPQAIHRLAHWMHGGVEDRQRWVKTSAESGDVDSMNEYGAELASAHNTTSDKRAYDWFIQAAESGFAPAMHNVATCHYTGRGVPQNTANALLWHYKAASAGYAASQFVMGYFAERGIGMDPNANDALTWYTAAGDAGHVQAQTRAAFLLEGTVPAIQNDAKAFTWYAKAATAGDPFAQAKLGSFLLQGRACQTDLAAGADWTRQSAKKGCGLGVCFYSECLTRGIGVQRDCAAGLAHLEQAAGQGFAEAAFRLGVLYVQGRFVKEDVNRGRTYLRQASNEGFALAARVLEEWSHNGYFALPEALVAKHGFLLFEDGAVAALRRRFE